MHLFSRRVQFVGPASDVDAHARGLRDYVANKAGEDVGLWAGWFGVPVGTFVYTVGLDGLSGVGALFSKFAGDATYEQMVAKGEHWVTGPVEDALSEPLHGGTGEPAPVGSVATVTSAVITGGRYAAAVTWGIDVSQHVEKVTGSPVMFGMDMFGTFGAVSWIGIAPDLVAADEANAKLNADATYLAKLGEIGDLFVHGSGRRALFGRIA